MALLGVDQRAHGLDAGSRALLADIVDVTCSKKVSPLSTRLPAIATLAALNKPLATEPPPLATPARNFRSSARPVLFCAILRTKYGSQQKLSAASPALAMADSVRIAAASSSKAKLPYCWCCGNGISFSATRVLKPNAPVSLRNRPVKSGP